MADVARLAGVSKSTVSRALSRPEVVSTELRARIDEAVRRLAYVPNLVAGSLATARTRTVGVIVPSIMNSFFAGTVEEMADALGRHGYQIMIGNSGYSEDREEAIVATFLAWSPAAMVVTGRRHSRRCLRLLLDAEIPVVEMWELGERPIDSLVGFSHLDVGRAVAHHLIARGAMRLAFIGAALDRDHRAAERGAGFAEFAQAAGLERPAWTALPDRASMAAGARGLMRLVEEEPAVDAVFFSNDVLALGGLFECGRRGWRVPERLRLCGFGDLDFTSASLPTLTTVRPPRAEIGRRIAELLVGRLGSAGDGSEVLDLGFELIAREST